MRRSVGKGAAAILICRGKTAYAVRVRSRRGGRGWGMRKVGKALSLTVEACKLYAGWALRRGLKNTIAGCMVLRACVHDTMSANPLGLQDRHAWDDG